MAIMLLCSTTKAYDSIPAWIGWIEFRVMASSDLVNWTLFVKAPIAVIGCGPIAVQSVLLPMRNDVSLPGWQMLEVDSANTFPPADWRPFLQVPVPLGAGPMFFRVYMTLLGDSNFFPNGLGPDEVAVYGHPDRNPAFLYPLNIYWTQDVDPQWWTPAPMQALYENKTPHTRDTHLHRRHSRRSRLAQTR